MFDENEVLDQSSTGRESQRDELITWLTGQDDQGDPEPLAGSLEAQDQAEAKRLKRLRRWRRLQRRRKAA